MLRSVLVGLDGSAYSAAAVELGLRWAREFDALLVGLAVVDVPTITAPEATPMGAAFTTGELDEERLAESRHTAEGWLEAFSLRCAEAGVASKVLEDEGDPVERFRVQAERFDLVLLGRKTHFRYATQSGPCDTLDRLLRRTARPVVAVPPELPAGKTVVVAYDGSPGAARAVYAYRASGIGAKYPTAVVTVGDDPVAAAGTAGRAVEFLGHGGVAATARPVTAGGRPGEALFEALGELEAGLLVMGAFGHSPAYEFFFGSTTRRVLKGTWVPVFLFH